MPWIFLGIAIVSEVVGTSALKAAEGFTRLMPSIIVVIGYGASFYFLSLTLKTIPMGLAYAVWSGVGLVLISVAGYVLYRQVLSLPQIAGMMLIGAGVILISYFSRSTAH
jgi:small multidrug resistance pump